MEIALVIVVVVLKVQALLDGPLGELFEKDHPVTISVYFFELSFNVHDRADPSLHHLLAVDELLSADPFVIIGIDPGEGGIVLKVHPQREQEVAELRPLDVVVRVLGLGLGLVFGGVVGPQNRRLHVEHLRDDEHVSDALIQLGEGEVAVAVDVEIVKHFHSPHLGLLVLFRRDPGGDQSPVDVLSGDGRFCVVGAGPASFRVVVGGAIGVLDVAGVGLAAAAAALALTLPFWGAVAAEGVPAFAFRSVGHLVVRSC